MNTLPKTLPSFFWRYIRQNWKPFLGAQIGLLGWTVDHTLWPVVMMLFIDAIMNFSGIQSEAWAAIATPVYYGVVLTVVLEILFRMAGLFKMYTFPNLEASVRMDMFDYTQRHSHNYFSDRLSGTLANKINDMPQTMTRFLDMVMSLYIPVILAVIISLALFFIVAPKFGCIFAIYVAIHSCICIYWSRKVGKTAHDHAEAVSTLSGKIVDSLTNHVNVRLFSRNRYERENLQYYQDIEFKKHRLGAWTMEKMKFWIGINSTICINFGLMGLLVYSWVQGELTAGEVVFIFNTTWNIGMMTWLAGLEAPLISKEIGVAKQALTLIQDYHEIIDTPEAKPLKIEHGHIQFENVSFKYNKQQDLFLNKNIHIHGGEKIGLVGFSGSGKSTFVNLILRYFEVEKGRILIDGQDISQVTQESLRKQIALIPQDTSLFHRTLRDNIQYGCLEKTQLQVIEAAKRARCHDFIQTLPEQYETLVGERGIKLSGGQRQRIAIARAILKNAPILILDEATSSLDSVTEREIQEGLHSLMEGKTTIVVAHRLSTLRNMDRILVFKEGKVVEEGPHEALLHHNGHYAHLWSMQAGGFLPE